jgi:small subunit ribosomal protein S13
MVYILNKYVSPKKTIGNALTNIYGLGHKRALAICAAIGIAFGARSLKLTSLQIFEICKHIAHRYAVGSDLKKKVYSNIRALIRARSYRGIRHQNNLPVRGQRTHTNAQTRRRWSL